MTPGTLFLASRSPRRAELLRQIGVMFRVIDIDVDERALVAERPDDYVLRVAHAKALAGAASTNGQGAVLAADTAVTIDGEIFGKPLDRADAYRMLGQLSARWHEVMTAVVVIHGGATRTALVKTRVEFRALDAATMDAYWTSGEPSDKAGAYGIQGLGGGLVRRIEGSYSAVVGLPLCETIALLEEAGVRHAFSR